MAARYLGASSDRHIARSSIDQGTAFGAAERGARTVRTENGLPSRADGALVGTPEIVAVGTMASAFGRMDNDFGGGHGRRALIQYLHSDVARMLRGRFSDANGRKLYQTASEATLLAAWMSYDAGIHGMAQRYFVQALRLAQAANDVRLGASVLDAMSHQATFLGRYPEAVNLARAAANGSAGQSTPTLRAHFLAMEARALAAAGDAAATDRALSAAIAEFDRRAADDDPPWIRYVDEAEIDAEFAHCFRDLGRAAEAVTHAQRSLAGADGASPRSDLFVSIVHAEGLVRQGAVDEACSIASQALTAGANLNSVRCEVYVATLMRALKPFEATAHVRDLAVAVEAWQAGRRR